jgi:hypothetical protein
MRHRQHRECPQGLSEMHSPANRYSPGHASGRTSPMVSALATASWNSGHVPARKPDSHARAEPLASHGSVRKRDTPLWGKSADWRAVCGKTARTVRREGRVERPLPTPIRSGGRGRFGRDKPGHDQKETPRLLPLIQRTVTGGSRGGSHGSWLDQFPVASNHTLGVMPALVAGIYVFLAGVL